MPTSGARIVITAEVELTSELVSPDRIYSGRWTFEISNVQARIQITIKIGLISNVKFQNSAFKIFYPAALVEDTFEAKVQIAKVGRLESWSRTFQCDLFIFGPDEIRWF